MGIKSDKYLYSGVVKQAVKCISSTSSTSIVDRQIDGQTNLNAIPLCSHGNVGNYSKY